MAKHQLFVEYDYDFDLIGIASQAKDYKLCWAINQKFQFKLTKDPSDLEIRLRKGTKICRYSVFNYYDELSHVEYFLIENKGISGYLLPEQEHADYFLMVKNDVEGNSNVILTKLKEIEHILMATIVNVSSLKQKENLIF